MPDSGKEISNRFGTQTGDETDGSKLIGTETNRIEDADLLTGNSKYVDDLSLPNQLYAAVLRSPHPHASIRTIETEAAEQEPGVVGVYTATDLLNSVPSLAENAVPAFIPPDTSVSSDLFRRVLALDRVRYQGEPIAVVVATDRYGAHDGLSLIDIEFDTLPTVTDIDTADSSDAQSVHDTVPDNVLLEYDLGDTEAVDSAFETADRSVSVTINEPRLQPNPIEPRGVLASYSSSEGLHVRLSSQNPHEDREMLSRILGLSEGEIRVSTPAVGGGFGGKIPLYPAEVAVAWCAVHLERPIKWQARRTESLQSDAHGRGMNITGELAVSDQGDILGLRASAVADMGAYVSTHQYKNPTSALGKVLPGQYDIPAVRYDVSGVLTNKTPVDAYRGITAVTAATLIERLVNRAAHRLNIDPATFRKRNFITEFPHESPTGLVYHSGNYEQVLETALESVQYTERRATQRATRRKALVGIGISSFIEGTAYGPGNITKQSGRDEHWASSRLVMHKSGDVSVYCGTSDHGQGHRTTYTQLVSDTLGVPPAAIHIGEDDTERIGSGKGTFASRSAVLGGSSLFESGQKLISKATKIAAHQLNVSPDRLEFSDGVFYVLEDPDCSMTIQDVATEAYRAWDLPDGVEPGLEVVTYYRPSKAGMPISFGCHVAVVEVLPETGEITVTQYVAVDDCGTQLNPAIVEGQIHGGIAQGIGQALYEQVLYDEDGSLLTESLREYAVPQAKQLPEIETKHTETLSPLNELGAKGVGEGGTIAAPAAIANAVVDALQPYGIDHIDMPITPEKVWQRLEKIGQ